MPIVGLEPTSSFPKATASKHSTAWATEENMPTVGLEPTSSFQLGRIQRMACLAITGAMKSAPTVAMEVLLNLNPLNLLIMGEARMALYRMYISKQTVDLKTETGLLSGKM
jgi:hypothetical protein